MASPPRPRTPETNFCWQFIAHSNQSLALSVSVSGKRDFAGQRQRQLAEPPSTLAVPWQKTPATRRREILLPEGIRPEHARPIRSETRARLIAAIARGRRWLDELVADPTATPDSIAKRENCSTRKINMTISLAYLAPDLVKAAIDGRLPHSIWEGRGESLSR
jgi:hypothetical protein